MDSQIFPERNPNSFFKKEKTCAISALILLLISLVMVFSLVGPFQPPSLPSIGFSLIGNSSLGRTCDYSFGRWVWDASQSNQSYSEDCAFMDPGFQCHRNGRKDAEYHNWRWQPHGCDLPKFNASEMLERSRNARIVFVGDSIGRNQWESLVCMLTNGVNNQSSIYEQNGNPITKHKGSLSIRFQDYNLTVEYYRVPFLVVLDRPPVNSSEQIKKAIRVDRLHWVCQQWVGADVLVFNAGHWWNQDKTIKMGFYFQEGDAINMTMDVTQAFRRSLRTWENWVLENLNPVNSFIFFRSYSPVHFRNGTWDSGGRCDIYASPQTNHGELEAEPCNNLIISETIEQLKRSNRKVQLLNITYLTEFRYDGHPSKHREPGTPVPVVQDCSHWCLPGVPDTWNGLLYAHLLLMQYDTKNTNKVN